MGNHSPSEFRRHVSHCLLTSRVVFAQFAGFWFLMSICDPLFSLLLSLSPGFWNSLCRARALSGPFPVGTSCPDVWDIFLFVSLIIPFPLLCSPFLELLFVGFRTSGLIFEFPLRFSSSFCYVFQELFFFFLIFTFELLHRRFCFLYRGVTRRARVPVPFFTALTLGVA